MVTFLVSYCDMYDFCIKMLVGWCLQLFVVSTLFVFVCIKVVSNTYCVVPYILFCLRLVSCVLNVACFSGLSSSCVLSAQCCQCLRIVFVLCLVCPMLSVSLVYPFLIAPSVFHNTLIHECSLSTLGTDTLIKSGGFTPGFWWDPCCSSF
jgi:hypothetical protein